LIRDPICPSLGSTQDVCFYCNRILAKST